MLFAGVVCESVAAGRGLACAHCNRRIRHPAQGMSMYQSLCCFCGDDPNLQLLTGWALESWADNDAGKPANVVCEHVFSSASQNEMKHTMNPFVILVDRTNSINCCSADRCAAAVTK